MFRGRSDDDSNDGESAPALRFKVPNFLGSLTERRRPAFVDDTGDDNLSSKNEENTQKLSVNIPVQADDALGSPFGKESVARSSTEAVKPMDVFRQLRQVSIAENAAQTHQTHPKEIILSTNPPQPTIIDSEQLQTRTPIESASDYETRMYHLSDQPNANDGHQQKRRSISNYLETEHQHSMPQPSHGPNMSEFSKEAEYRMNQVVGLLGQIISMGNRANEEVYLAKSELSMEREACKQMQAMLELEKQCKLQAQEDVINSRKTIANLTEKINSVQHQRIETEREKIALEGAKTTLHRELESASVEKELLKAELETVQSSLQDVERSLAILSQEKSALETDLCTQKAHWQELEARLTKELKLTLKSNQEAQEQLNELKKENQRLSHIHTLDLDALNEQIALLRGCIQECLKTLGKSDVALENQPDTLMTEVNALFELSRVTESNLEQRFSELNNAIVQKNEALQHCAQEMDLLRLEKGKVEAELKIASERDKEHVHTVSVLSADFDSIKKAHANMNACLTEISQFFGAAEVPLEKDEILKLMENYKKNEEERLRVLEAQASEARAELDKVKTTLEAERDSWNQEKQRLAAERLRLVQENGQLKRTPPSASRPVSADTSTESIVKAIEADLMKARRGSSSGPSSVQSKIEATWKTSDSLGKSPLKRSAPAGRTSSRKKKLAMAGANEHRIGQSPLRSQSAASELDFWAFSKERS